MEKVQYDYEPQQLKRDPDGSSIFCWDIEKKTSEEGGDIWECYEVRMYVTPTIKSVKEAAITSMWPHNIEFKMINDYNESVISGNGVTDEYQEFLAERKRIKEIVDVFFEQYI